MLLSHHNQSEYKANMADKKLQKTKKTQKQKQQKPSRNIKKEGMTVRKHIKGIFRNGWH